MLANASTQLEAIQAGHQPIADDDDVRAGRLEDTPGFVAVGGDKALVVHCLRALLSIVRVSALSSATSTRTVSPGLTSLDGY
ncbi:MAG TPA: hypothetical protein VFH48_17665 [Chloroflexota bacterium]|nr:hypothetical protein [Chloroflexota bacterium]